MSGSVPTNHLPAKIKPFWVEVPLLMQLYLHGLLRGEDKDVKNGLPIEQYKFTDTTVIFSFPGIEKRCELPRIYWGMNVYCSQNQCYYKIPAPGDYPKDKFFKATTLDEQLDSKFWFDN